MLEILLKAHRPEKFKDRVANEHTGAGGGPIATANVDLSKMTPEEASRTYRQLMRGPL
jgi:hypothetical protein